MSTEKTKQIEQPLISGANTDVATLQILEKKIKNYKDGPLLNTATCFCFTSICIAAIFFIFVAFTSQTQENISTTRFHQNLFQYSPNWVSSMNILPSDPRVESYLMSQKPDLIRSPLPVLENYILYPGANYSFVLYDLMCGSEIFLKYSTASNSSLGFYIIKGKDSFSYYTTQYYYEGPLNGNFYSRYMQYSNSPYGSVSYSVENCNEGDSIYFVWESTKTQTLSANFSLAVNIYDTVSYRLQSCKGNCDFKLDYGSNQVALISPYEFLNNGTFSSVTMTQTKRFSTWLYLGLGISFPFALIATVLFAPYFILKISFFWNRKNLAKYLAKHCDTANSMYSVETEKTFLCKTKSEPESLI